MNHSKCEFFSPQRIESIFITWFGRGSRTILWTQKMNWQNSNEKVKKCLCELTDYEYDNIATHMFVWSEVWALWPLCIPTWNFAQNNQVKKPCVSLFFVPWDILWFLFWQKCRNCFLFWSPHSNGGPTRYQLSNESFYH